jgi:hypothetical protein
LRGRGNSVGIARVRSPVRQRRPQDPRAPAAERAPSPVDRVLELQRSAGNAAVARHIRSLAREGWPEAGGWNKQARPVTGTLRIPIAGLTQGY